MKEYLLLVLEPSFLKATSFFIDQIYQHGIKLGNLKESKEDFSMLMFGLLKRYWHHHRDDLPDDFIQIIPPPLREAVCMVVKKQARSELKLENGTSVPQFNYAGKLLDAGQIPNILSVLATQERRLYNKDGTVPNQTSDIAKSFEGFKSDN